MDHISDIKIPKCESCHIIAKELTQIKIQMANKSINFSMCSNCLKTITLMCSEPHCSKKVNLISSQLSCATCHNFYCLDHLSYDKCQNTICNECLIKHRCVCGDTRCFESGQCYECHKPMHKHNDFYSPKNGCVIRHKMVVCCQCFNFENKYAVLGTHTKKHFICACKREFCIDEPKINCDMCCSKEYHLTPKEIQAVCSNLSDKNI